MRYDRHLKLEGFGPVKQQLLKKAAVLVIGAGGLGVPVLQYLTAMGIGKLGIIEHDTISLSNLQRQVLYHTAEEGQSKLKVAVARLSGLNPEVHFVKHDSWLTQKNALSIMREYDVIIDCSDNFGTRYLVNDACVILQKPFIYGAIHKYEGQVSVFNFNGSATYRCLFPEQPGADALPNCNDIGVLGVLPGIIGCYQANEAVKVICGIGTPLTNQLMTIDTLNNTQHIFTIKPVPENQQITTLQEDYEQPCDTSSIRRMSVQELCEWREAGKPLQLIDVREPDEWEICKLPHSLLIPMGMINGMIPQLRRDIPTALLCHHGMRSLIIAQQLDAAGFTDLYNVEGGIHAWACQIDEKMDVY